MAVSYCTLAKGRRFRQDGRFHKMGLDAVLLSHFYAAKKNALVCDMGAGQGALSLLLLLRAPSLTVHGVELLPEAADVALQNMAENGFAGRFLCHTGDLRAWNPSLTSRFDGALCNPPYFKAGAGKAAGAAGRQAARCEGELTPGVLCAAAARLLREGGEFAVVYRPERLADMLCAMRNAGLEPKRLRMVQKDKNAAPCLALIAAKKGAAPSLSVRPPLFLTDEAGGESRELRQIYRETGCVE